MGKEKPNFKLGILTKAEIKNLSLIENSDVDCFQHASYDLRLGEEYLVASHKESSNKIGICNCKDNKIIVLPPFTSAILSTYEIVKLPGNVAGRFDLKIKPALRGLMVQMGTQIEPWYYGRLFALVHNISDQRKLLIYNSARDSLFNIEFHYTSGTTERPPKYAEGKKYEALSEFLTGIDIGSSLDSFLDQLRQTKDDVNRAVKESKGWNSIRLTLVLALATLFIGMFLPYVLNKITYNKDDYPLATANQIAQIRTQNNVVQYYMVKQMEFDSLSRLQQKIDKSELSRRKNELETLEKYLKAIEK